MAHFPFKSLALTALVWLAAGCSNKDVTCNRNAAIPADPEIESKVEKTLSSMTLEQKAGQMVQISLDILTKFGKEIDPGAVDHVIGECKVGSILNIPGAAPDTARMRQYMRIIQEASMDKIGIPCIYGLDMIHGATYYKEGTFFPQEINIAATFNPEYAKALGEAIGYETRAGFVPWTFSPVMDLTRNAAWPRNWESYGEDPYLQSVMASAETTAIQGDDPNNIDKYHCAVSIKHYMGYGNPASGKDRTPAYIAENDLREKYFAPFKACIEAGALTVMVNSAAINGIPTHANKTLLTGWLKDGLNWDGMIVTDWADINNLFTRDHVAADRKEALALGINAGIDMIMDPYDPQITFEICELVKEGKIDKSRIDDAARRILRLKYRLGLFDDPLWENVKYDKFGSPEFKAASKAAAVESAVLLKNNGILPLKKNASLAVTGPNSNSIRTLNGGWSYTWQGSDDPYYVDSFNTIYEALKGKFDGRVTCVEGVSYRKDGGWQEEDAANIAMAYMTAMLSDAVIVCIGENSYCETPGNMDDLTLSSKQAELIKDLAKTGRPIILVINGGRPRIIAEVEQYASAIIDVMLPGNYGADALADLLCGDENFSGKLPFTYPKHVNSLHTYDYKASEFRETMEGEYNYDAIMDVQWPFGYGLSYTTFEYSDLQADRTEFKSGDTIDFTVKVKNTGDRAGKEAVLLYSSDLVASLMPDARRLRAFTKIELAPGEEKTVTLSIRADDLAFVGADGRWRLEAGDFRISTGKLNTIIKCTQDKLWESQNIQ